jgi:hypothetical protein
MIIQSSEVSHMPRVVSPLMQPSTLPLHTFLPRHLPENHAGGLATQV